MGGRRAQGDQLRQPGARAPRGGAGARARPDARGRARGGPEPVARQPRARAAPPLLHGGEAHAGDAAAAGLPGRPDQARGLARLAQAHLRSAGRAHPAERRGARRDPRPDRRHLLGQGARRGQAHGRKVHQGPGAREGRGREPRLPDPADARVHRRRGRERRGAALPVRRRREDPGEPLAPRLAQLHHGSARGGRPHARAGQAHPPGAAAGVGERSRPGAQGDAADGDVARGAGLPGGGAARGTPAADGPPAPAGGGQHQGRGRRRGVRRRSRLRAADQAARRAVPRASGPGAGS